MSASSDSTDKELKVLRKKNARLLEQVAELRAKLALADNHIDDLQVELDVIRDTTPPSFAPPAGTFSFPSPSTSAEGQVKKGAARCPPPAVAL